MTPHQKLGLTIDGFFASIFPDKDQPASQRLQCFFRITPRCLRTVTAIALLLVIRGSVLAQQAVRPEAAHAVVFAGTASNAGDIDSADASRPASDSGTISSSGVSPVRAASATITGTVLDVNGDIVPGATVVLNAASAGDRREATADDSAAFKFDSLTPGISYEVTINVKGFSSWNSAAIVLEPSQFLILNDIHLKMESAATSVTVFGGSTEEIAVEQVHLEEQQRVLGIIPNFYVAYDGANTVPLTTKLKFKLAMRVARDPVSILGIGFMAGINQAANRPDYQQGAAGFGQRLGASAAGAFSDILIGGAILPSLLHQDPRYFYQGTGSTGSRVKHALESPFICRGDNGHRQINFSSIGGDLGATALSKTYFPSTNRGTGDLLVTFGINQGERMIAAIAQEFIFPHFTPSLKKRTR